MAFTKSGNIITQTAGTTDTDLSALGDVKGTSVAIGAVTDYSACEAEGGVFNDVANTCSVVTFPDRVITTFQGTISNYTLPAGATLAIGGTLTINPEFNVLHSRANQMIRVDNGGRLNLGEEITSTVDGSVRKTEGLAVTGQRAQKVWYGASTANSSIAINSGGTLVCKGATTEFSGLYYFVKGSHVWIDGLIHNVHDYVVDEGTIDPQTGSIVANSVGVNTGANIGAGGRLTKVNRGYIGWTRGGDIRVDDWLIVGGGEFSFGASGGDTFSFDAAVNTLSGTPNGFFGYSAAGAKAPILADLSLKGTPLLLENIRLFNLGNFKSIAIQGRDFFGQAIVTNAYNGSELILASDLLVNEARNGRIYGSVGRNINTDIKDGLTGGSITGGAFFYRDVNNSQRKSFNSVDDTADKTFISALVDSNLSADHKVILKIVNVTAGAIEGGTSNDIRGIDRSFNVTRVDGSELTYDDTDFGAAITSDTFNFYSTTTGGVTTTHDPITPTAGQTSFAITTNATDTIVLRIFQFTNTPFIGDLRTESGIEGEDTFDFVFWHPEYNSNIFTDYNVTDKTLGTKVITANILPDVDYSNTSASSTTADTVDELYDLIKQRKSDANEALATGIEYPTKETLAVSKSGNLLDIGLRSFATQSGTGQYTISNSALSAHTTEFEVGTKFLGVLTTSSINLTNIKLAGGMIMTGATITNFPASIGDSILNPGNNIIVGTGGHTVTADSIINANLSISGTSANVLGGTINGTFTLTGGDTDFSGSVNETGGLTTGNISLNSVTKRTVDFKPGSITNGTIVASTATNLVLDGTHNKAISRTTGTATTEAGGTLNKELTVGSGVLTTTSTLDSKELVVAGSGNHIIAGLFAKKLTLGSGDSTVSATISSGGLEMDGGLSTLSGNITGDVNTDGNLTTESTFLLVGNIDASDGDSTIAGDITGNVQIADALEKHVVSATISGKLQMGAGTKNKVTGSIDGLVESDGTIDTTTMFVGGSTVTANTAIGVCNVDGIIAGLVTLGSASTGKHTVGADIGTSGTPANLVLGLGVGHIVNGNVTGTVTTTGTLATGEEFECGSTITANTATGDSTINSNSTGITGNVLLGDATNGHTFSGKTAADLTMGDGAHTISGTVGGNLDTGDGTTAISGMVSGTVAATGSDRLTVSGTVGGTLTHSSGPITTTSNADTKKLVIGAGNSNLAGTVVGDVDIGAGNSTVAGTITGDVDIGTGANIVSAAITGNLDIDNGATNFSGSVSLVTTLGTGVQTLSGTATGVLTTTGTINSTSTFNSGDTVTSTATSGNNTINSNATGIGGKVTLGNATGGHTISGTITTGGLEMGTGTHTISSTGNITGAVIMGTGVQVINGIVDGTVTTAGTLTTGVSSDCKSTVESTATGTVANTFTGRVRGNLTLLNGDHNLSGIMNGNVNLGTGAQTIGGTIDGTLDMGTGAKALNGTVKGAVTTTGTLTTGLVSNCQSTVTSTATSTSTINGTLNGKLTLAAANHAVGATITTGGMTLGAGNHTIDTPSITGEVLLGDGASSLTGTFVNGVTTGDGNTTLDGSFEDITDGTGTLVLALDTTVSGTITKSGDGEANGLTVDENFDTSNPLTVPDGTLEIFGVSSWVGTIDGDVHFNAAPSTTRFEIPAGLPNGRVLLRNITDSITSADQAYTGTKITLATFTNVSSGAKEYRVYYKATNTFGADGVFYLTTTATGFNNNSTDTVVSVVRADHPNVLTVDAELASYTGLTATLNTITSQTEATITIAGATSELSAPQSQGLMLRVTDDASYLNLLANNEVTEDYILPLELDGTTIDTNRLTLTALAESGQQLMKSVSGIGGGTLVGNIETGGTPANIQAVFIATGGNLTKADVESAVDDSTTGNRVKDMRGNDLLGLAPQEEDNN